MMLVSYMLPIMTIALSQPQFAIECLWCSIQQGVGHFGSKFQGISFWVDLWCWGPRRVNTPS